jgi:uncharacterized membrane protein
MYQDPMPEGGPVFVGVMIGLIVLTVVVVNLVSILVFCKIFAKAGYHWALGLLVLVPIANVVMPFFLAFADWPILKELSELRRQQGAVTGQRTHQT